MSNDTKQQLAKIQEIRRDVKKAVAADSIRKLANAFDDLLDMCETSLKQEVDSEFTKA
jgi:hypothetical protein